MTIPNNWNVFCWSRSVRGGELFDSIHLTPGLVPVTSLGPSNWLRNPRSAQNVTLAKNISHIQVLVTNFFSNPTNKTGTGTATASRWETTDSKQPSWGQSNYLPNQKQGPVNNKYNTTVFIRLLQGSERCGPFQGLSRAAVFHWILLMNLIQDFLVQAGVTYWASLEMGCSP